MGMTKELKKISMKGFEEMLISLWVSQSFVAQYELNGDEEGCEHWREKRETYQKTILKAIEGLIEVEEE